MFADHAQSGFDGADGDGGFHARLVESGSGDHGR